MLWLTRADLKPIAEKAASDALGRAVAADNFSIGWGDPLHIELSNLRVANAQWGSDEQMIALKNFSADVELASLWRGMPIYRHLRADGLKVVLERNEQGIGNWKFGSDSSRGGFALIPKNRTQFPTLLDMVLKDALITYRTYADNVLRIQLDNVAIASSDDVSPVALKAAGAYNNTPLGLDATTASFRELRVAEKPFKTMFSLFGKTARLKFDGTQMEPLDFEGVDGALNLNADELDNLLASFGADMVARYPLTVDTHLTRKGDHWELTRAKGRLDRGAFSGQLILDEGRRGASDHVTTDLSFGRLDLDRLLASQPSDEPHLSAPKESSTILDTHLRAGQFVYRDIDLRDIELGGHLESGLVQIETLRFPFGGGRVLADIDIAERVAAAVTVNGINVDQLAQKFGATAGDLTGEIMGRFKLDMPSGSLRAALSQSQGAAVLSMGEGSIRRAILEKMSTDLRTLFREKEGSAPIKCLGGVMMLENGVAIVAPLRLMAKGAVVNGGGWVDLAKRQVDLEVRSERKSTGFFALDLPIRINGSFDRLSAGLAADSAKKWVPPAPPKAAALDPDMHQLMSGNPCLN